MTDRMLFYAKLSLSFLWIFTGLTSLFFGREIGYDVLASGGIKGLLADIFLFSGSLLDALLGIWLLAGWKAKLCYLIQLSVIITYSVLLTIIDPSFWLHPFGPLTKNIPLIVLIGILYESNA